MVVKCRRFHQVLQRQILHRHLAHIVHWSLVKGPNSPFDNIFSNNFLYFNLKQNAVSTYNVRVQPSKNFIVKNLFRSTAERLVQMYGHLLPQGQSDNQRSFHPRERILHFLYYCGNNHLYRSADVSFLECYKCNLPNTQKVS